MVRTLAFAIWSCALLAAPAFAGVVTPDLAQRAAALAPGTEVPVIIRMADRVDLRGFTSGRAGAPEMIGALRATAARSQAGVLRLLRQWGRDGRARSLWIDNSVAVSVPADRLATLADAPGVESVEFDEPVRMADSDPTDLDVVSAGWNVIKVRATDVWTTSGLDGTGVLIGSMDTGFDPNHPALAGKWRGGAHSWIDIINAMPAPYDDHGHGTHTTGTLVGGDGAGPSTSDIGIAYGARFISAKVLDATNSFSSASIVVSGAQWMLDPDGNPSTNDFPQVINNSWLFFSKTYTGFYATVAAWRAAGIIPVFCIANDGPASSTTHPPGNYDNVIGVGATDAGDVIASFSSRGPAPAGPGFPADGRKPDLCAPGAGVTSSVPGGGYQAWDGTSMASPHVAATIALMIQAHPGLTYDQARQSLLDTAVDLGPAGYDYDYGYGRLDAFEAVHAAATDAPASATPSALRLAAWPNPFRSAVTFALGAPGRAGLTVRVHDLQGRRVWSSPAASAEALRWDGRDGRGAHVPPGVYVVSVTDGRSSRALRVVCLR